jgi:hypothetical protein
MACFWYDLSVGLLANFAFLALLLALSFAFSHIASRSLFDFFGVRSNRRLTVYYGIFPSGSVGVGESQEVWRFARLFQHRIPGLREGDSMLKTIFFNSVQVSGVPSPVGTQINLAQSIITLGSPLYTHASDIFETKLENRVSIRDNTIHIPGTTAITDQTQAIIVKKCRDGLAYFYVAGITEEGTLSASRYLAENWKQMHKKYPNEESFFMRLQYSQENEIILLSEAPLD